MMPLHQAPPIFRGAEHKSLRYQYAGEPATGCVGLLFVAIQVMVCPSLQSACISKWRRQSSRSLDGRVDQAAITASAHVGSPLWSDPSHGLIRNERPRPARCSAWKNLHRESDHGLVTCDAGGLRERPRLPRVELDVPMAKRVEEGPVDRIVREEGEEFEMHNRSSYVLQDQNGLDFRHATLRGVGDETDVGKGDFGGSALYPERCRSDAQDDGGREGDGEHHSAIACKHRSYR